MSVSKISSADPEQALLHFYHLLRAADWMSSMLPQRVRAQIEDPLFDVLSRVIDVIVSEGPSPGFSQARSYDSSLRGHVLVHLIEEYLGSSCPADVPVWKIDGWKEYLRDWDEQGHADAVLNDPSVHTVEDLIAWFRRNDAQLFPQQSG